MGSMLVALPAPPADKSGWPWTAASPRLPTLMPDGQPWPKISIVTPSYNQGQFIEETIRSVLLQGYPNLEYIIIDGGSSDESVEIIKKYEPWLTYWVSERDAGQSDAIMKGFVRATGTILAWLNSDDLLQPGALHRVSEYWCYHSDCHFLSGDGEFVDTAAQHRLHYIKVAPYTHADLLGYHRGHYLPQPAVFFSRKAFEQAGGLDLSLRYTMDLDLWLRLSSRHKLHYLPACLAQLRCHTDAKTWRDNTRALTEAYEVIRRHTWLLSPRWQVQLAVSYRMALSRSECQRGLIAYFAGGSVEATAALSRAMAAWPAVVSTRAGSQLWLRLLFPLAIKRRIFQNP